MKLCKQAFISQSKFTHNLKPNCMLALMVVFESDKARPIGRSVPEKINVNGLQWGHEQER